jgi:tRNA(Ile)-lysidine synthase
LRGEHFGVQNNMGLAAGSTQGAVARPATLRVWRAGDRVTLRHSRGPKKVAEVLDRLRVIGEARKNWPVVESEGTLLWMRGVEIEVPGFVFTVLPLP